MASQDHTLTGSSIFWNYDQLIMSLMAAVLKIIACFSTVFILLKDQSGMFLDMRGIYSDWQFLCRAPITIYLTDWKESSISLLALIRHQKESQTRPFNSSISAIQSTHQHTNETCVLPSRLFLKQALFDSKLSHIGNLFKMHKTLINTQKS